MKKLFCLVAIAGLLLTGCGKEEQVIEAPQEPQKVDYKSMITDEMREEAKEHEGFNPTNALIKQMEDVKSRGQ